MAVTTNISLHLITGIKAIDHNAFGKPLMIHLASRYGDTDLTLFFEDEGLSKLLCEAINAAVEAAKEPKVSACPMERAAYEAMEQSFSRWSGL